VQYASVPAMADFAAGRRRQRRRHDGEARTGDEPGRRHVLKAGIHPPTAVDRHPRALAAKRTAPHLADPSARTSRSRWCASCTLRAALPNASAHRLQCFLLTECSSFKFSVARFIFALCCIVFRLRRFVVVLTWVAILVSSAITRIMSLNHVLYRIEPREYTRFLTRTGRARVRVREEGKGGSVAWLHRGHVSPSRTSSWSHRHLPYLRAFLFRLLPTTAGMMHDA
jgi:hypothetical protein